MNIAGYKTAIKTWVEAQTDLKAQWRDEEGGWHQKTRIFLHLKNPRTVGVDFLTYHQDTDLDPGEDYIPTVHGFREITLSIRIESRDQSGSNVANYYQEKLKASLIKPSVKNALYDAGLSFATAEAPADFESIVDNRVESVSVMDLHFNTRITETDENEADSFVETFTTAATLTTPAGGDVGWDEKVFGE